MRASIDRNPLRCRSAANPRALRTAGSIRPAFGQGIEAAFAGGSGCAGSVSVSSKVCRSFVKPALHVGEQIAGGVGCRATAGRSGIFGASTTTGGDGGDTLAQPASSISSAGSISAGAVKFGLCIGRDLHEVGVAAFAFRSCLRHGLPRGLLLLAQLFGVAVQRAGVGALLKREAVGLQAGDHQGADEGPGGGAGNQGADHDSSPFSQAGIGTVCPASPCVQSPRNCICPSRTKLWHIAGGAPSLPASAPL